MAKDRRLAPHGASSKAALLEAPANMTWIAGGVFAMGSDHHYPEEAPSRRVEVKGFWIDTTPVTNRDYARFVEATGHVTVAEIAPDPADYPGLTAETARAGSLVFHRTERPVDTNDPSLWWRFEAGTNWRHPLGASSDIESLELWDHPVVHIAYADAQAYANWTGRQLPTEAEFEFAARGGLEASDYAWGDELAPDGFMLANYWQGLFPMSNLLTDGWERTSPVTAFPVNGYGVHDLIGNVWEWTSDWWGEAPASTAGKRSCCVTRNPRGGRRIDSFDPAHSQAKIGRKVLKGGSHLCAPNYCQRYRPAARQPQTTDTSTSHIGFRCVLRGRPLLAASS